MAGSRDGRADSGGPRQIGPFFDVVVHKTGLRTIVFQLERAAGSGDHEAVAAAFKEADGIRRQSGWSWAGLICRRPGDGGNGNAPL
ncbi:MAG: hypothetical protein IH905_05565 [Proteobacteria bacterium]|nr:hypothetical protein [Pseudomonadota bacterium]